MNEKNHVKPKSGLKSLLGPMSSLLAVVAVTCLLASLGTWAAHSKLLAAPQPAVAAAASEPEVPTEAGNTAAETPVLPAPTATPVADAQPATALPTLEPGEEGQAPSPPIHTPTPASTGTSLQHTVQQGETLGGVAQAYGVSVEALVAANDITNPDTIYAGQTLRIPTDGVTTPISATTPPADAPTPGASPALPSEVQEERWIDVDLSHRFPSERFGACRLASIHDDTVNAEPPRYWALCTVSRQIGQLWGVLESLRRLHLLGILANCYTSREIDVSRPQAAGPGQRGRARWSEPSGHSGDRGSRGRRRQAQNDWPAVRSRAP